LSPAVLESRLTSAGCAVALPGAIGIRSAIGAADSLAQSPHRIGNRIAGLQPRGGVPFEALVEQRDTEDLHHLVGGWDEDEPAAVSACPRLRVEQGGEPVGVDQRELAQVEHE